MRLAFGDAEHLGKDKRTRKQVFLGEMEQVVPWTALEAFIEPHYPKAGRVGRQPYPLQTMLRIHLLPQWFSLSDPGAEDALYEMPTLRQFARLGSLADIPYETTILNFRRLLERNGLAEQLFNAVNEVLAQRGERMQRGTMVDAMIIHAPSSTKNADGKRDPEMHQTKMGKQWFFEMKAHIGADTHTGLVHSVVCTAAKVADMTQAQHLLLGGDEVTVHGDNGCTGAGK